MMDSQDFARKDTVSASSLMAAWMASGGALDAVDAASARQARSAQGTALADDDGLRAVGPTQTWPCADDGLRAVGPTQTWPCVNDGLHAVGYTGTPRMCADDGLEIGRVTGFPCI